MGTYYDWEGEGATGDTRVAGAMGLVPRASGVQHHAFHGGALLSYARRQTNPRPGAKRKASANIAVATSTTAAPEATLR
jgi:hypothetical protein